MPVFQVLCRFPSASGPQKADLIVVADDVCEATMVAILHRGHQGQPQGRFHAIKITNDLGEVKCRVTRYFVDEATTVHHPFDGLDRASDIAREVHDKQIGVVLEVLSASGDYVKVDVDKPYIEPKDVRARDIDGSIVSLRD